MKNLMVTEIERFAIHDGPGIRTLVFFKGCPLKCRWCSNPETQSLEPQMMLMRSRCKGCGACIPHCPQKAIFLDNEGLIHSDRTKCIDCGACIEPCIYYARKMTGKEYTVQELVDICLKDESAYKHSGGGITISGGEPTVQAKELIPFLEQCKSHRLNIGMETCAFCDWEDLDRITDYLDYVFVDIKNMDKDAHREFTGASNKLILENIRKLSDKGVPMVISIPVIPGFNDTEENIRETAEFAKTLDSLKRVRLLPYHRLGTVKFDGLDREYPLEQLRSPEQEQMNRLRDIVEDAGVQVTVGY